MHIYISGIGGTAMASLALIAHEAGYEVSGSDARPSQYLEYLRDHGITETHIGVDDDFISKIHGQRPIDWFVYGSAQPMDFPDHPEFKFCEDHNIKQSKRDEFLSHLIQEKNLKLVSIAGTHGKTTTTAMATWVFKQSGMPVSYSGGAKLSFGDVAEFDAKSEYFVYETDEYDRNFLSFYPETALISGIDWDHPDIYPTRESYDSAFREFFDQSKKVVLWHDDAERLGLEAEAKFELLDKNDAGIENIKLAGLVNRQNAWLVARGLAPVVGKSSDELIEILGRFPGVSRRFEQIAPNIYSDSAHTPGKIRGALQLAHEVAGDNVVVIYEGLHNLRQHFIKDELANLFDGVKKLYVVPSYLAREDPNLPILSPSDLVDLLGDRSKKHAEASEIDDKLAKNIESHVADGDLVLCLTAGGAGSLDEWLRKNF
ncbi:MAG TPA: Mur ligase domain-containing protein [Candidatus Saccharimonadales bacterium]|nr:Mur ligase domain-containing protein [Candidatus Saccharimonadales bacterium]